MNFFWWLCFAALTTTAAVTADVEYNWRNNRTTGQIMFKTTTSSPSGHWNKALLSGSSWFGFETQDFVINGLWNHPVSFYIETLEQLGINIIRIPFSAEWVLYNWDLYPYDGLVGADPLVQNKMSREILDIVIQEAADHGMGVMLDLHRLHKEYISELWYSPTDNQYTYENWFQTWFTILDYVLPRHNNIVAIDLQNEPHGPANWGSDDPATDWRLFVQTAIPRIQDRYPSSQFLFFIEGVEWGHTLEGWHQKNRPLDLPEPLLDRVVFSPHTYGKSVVPSTPDDVGSLRWSWDDDFGFLRDLGFPIVVGEWGGRTDLDQTWMNHLVDYLIAKNCTNQFFWSLGPNSGDVNGILLDDWTTVDGFKREVIQRVVPEPTKFVF